MATTYQTPIANDYLELRAELGTALFALLALARETNASPDVIGTLVALQNRLREPFLFVAAGETRAGKSALLNALFGREFCPVDAPPATGRVQVFKYGEPARDVPLADGVVERYLPAGFLRDFNVVDPADADPAAVWRFAPQADVILFVLSVVNPWDQSVWHHLEALPPSCRAKVVFVLQQTDLRGEGEVQTIIQHLRPTAVARLGRAFPIFPVSAKKAFLSKTSGVDKARLWQESRLGPLEDHINEIVGRGGGRLANLREADGTAQTVLDQFIAQTVDSQRVAVANRAVLEAVRDAAAAFRQRATSQVEAFQRGIDTAIARCRHQGEHLLRQRLRLWPALRLMCGLDAQWEGDFQRNIESMLRAAITRQTEHALGLLDDELQSFRDGMHASMQANLSPGARQQLAEDTAGFTDRGARLLEKIELATIEILADERTEKDFHAVFAAPVAWMLLAAAAAATGVLAAVLIWRLDSMSVALGMGVAAMVLVVVADQVVAAKRRKVLATYHEQMRARQEQLTAAVGGLVRQAVAGFYERITHVYEPVGAFCNRQDEMHRPLVERVESLKRTFREIAGRL